jgi:hypothetical protein
VKGGGGLGFFMSVSRESNFFTHQVDQKYCLYIHEVKDACMRDLNNNCVHRVTGNLVSEKG